MAHELGRLIEAEVSRAESDLSALRGRGQSVLTASGAIVTLLAGLIAFSVGQDVLVNLNGGAKTFAAIALLAFVAATVVVLIMYLPAGVDAPSSQELARHAQESWDAATWEKDVAVVLTKYLSSLRSANGRLVVLLRIAIGAEVVGIACVAVMAMSLL